MLFPNKKALFFYPKLVDILGIILLTRTLLIPVIRGSGVVVATAMGFLRVRSTRATTMVVRAVSRFAWFCPQLEYNKIIFKKIKKKLVFTKISFFLIRIS